MTVNKHNADLIQGRMILASLKASAAKIPSVPYFTTLSALLSQFINMYENMLNSQIEVTPDATEEIDPCGTPFSYDPTRQLDPCAESAPYERYIRFTARLDPCPSDSNIGATNALQDPANEIILKSSVFIYLVTYSDTTQGQGRYPNRWVIGSGVLTETGIWTHTHYNTGPSDDTIKRNADGIGEPPTVESSLRSLTDYYEWIEIRGAFGTITMPTNAITGGAVALQSGLHNGVLFLTYPEFDPRILGYPVKLGAEIDLHTADIRAVTADVGVANDRDGADHRPLDTRWCDLNIIYLELVSEDEFWDGDGTGIEIPVVWFGTRGGANVQILSGDSGGGLFAVVDNEVVLIGIDQNTDVSGTRRDGSPIIVAGYALVYER